jgi:tetratricopeptide (TPR) repeat protein
MIKRYLILVLFLLSLHFSYAANNVRIDSLLGVLSQKQPDTARIRTLLVIADVYYRQGDIPQSTKHCKEAMELSKNQKDSTFLASSYAFMGGTICNGIGDFTSALDYLLKAYQIAEKINNGKLLYSISNGLGNTYLAKKNLAMADKYYNKAFRKASDLKDTLGIGITHVGLGNVAGLEKKYDLSIDYMLKAADCFKNRGRLSMYHTVYQNIVSAYLEQKLADKALMSMNEIIKQVEEDNNKYVLANAYQLYGEIYFQKKDFDKSLHYYYKSIEVFKSFSAIYDLERIYNKVAEVYSNAKRNDSAYHYMQLCLAAKDSIYSAENSKLVAEMQEKYESEKKAEENKLLLSQNELAENRIKQQKRLQFGLLLFLAMAFVFSFFLYRSNKQKQKNNQIILKQKEEVELQKALLQVKNTEVLDSINYAKRLQEAILPSARAIKKYFPQSFVLYKPKDIVAGDFYWMEHLGRELEAILNFKTPDRDLLLLAVADCTGHGVPGAIVSVVCSNALNRTVKEFGITEPGKILDKVRELVAKTFVREDSDSEVRDGMDISLISLKYNTESDCYTAEWAGANNPIWIVRRTSGEHATRDALISDSEFELEEIKADKQAIGRVDSPKPFTTHSLPLNKGDMLYLFTDGYADQFGGREGKKFKYKQLKDEILKNAHLPMKEQGAVLAGTLESWRGNLEQVDDILIIGITL